MPIPYPGLRSSCWPSRVIFFCVSLLAFAMPGVLAAGTLIENQTIQHDGLIRYFNYYAPDIPEAPVAALVFLFHGGTQDKDAITNGAYQTFFSLADQHGFYLVMPNGVDPTTGISGPTGSFNWNDCRGDMGSAETTADDVGFVDALIDAMLAGFPIDDQRIYATGASNGGLMSYRLAFELSDRIAATASVIANLPTNSECPSQPVFPTSILIMNATGDTIMPYDGGEVGDGRGFVESTDATRDFFLEFLDIQSPPETFQFPDLDVTDGGVVNREIYAGGVDGTQLTFFRVTGAGHTVPSIAHPAAPIVEFFLGKQNHDIEAANEIWNHLSVVTLPEPGLPPSLLLGLLGLAWAQRRRALRVVPRSKPRQNPAPVIIQRSGQAAGRARMSP